MCTMNDMMGGIGAPGEQRTNARIMCSTTVLGSSSAFKK
jgi:hypothetical protein